MRSPMLRLFGSILSIACLTGNATATEAAESDGQFQELQRVSPLSPRIVNGVKTPGAFPEVGLLMFGSGAGTCTGTLIGCNTFLTAAHCFKNSLNPALYTVYLQHAGFFGVSSITRRPDYVDGDEGHPGDVAVLKLTPATTGVRPAPINAIAKPGFGLPGLIVGFGGIGGQGNPGVGLLRGGTVTTANCFLVPNTTHLCWDFLEPIGPPGTKSSTCQGDSGGPLFLDSVVGPVVAGVTSAGVTDCLAPGHVVDVDVYANRSWIQSVAGPDINSTSCGAIPHVFDANTGGCPFRC